MEKIIRKIDLSGVRGEDARQMLRREWLVTNGLGGYASGTIAGTITWRYHGYLIAALPAPLGRIVMLNHVVEALHLPGRGRTEFGGGEPHALEDALTAGHFVTEFRLENQLPVWRYEIEGLTIEKHVLMLAGQNTTHITYRLLTPAREAFLELRPSMHFRPHEQAVNAGFQEPYLLSMDGERFEVSRGHALPALKLRVHGTPAQFTYEGGSQREIYYQKEADRGYESRGLLWSPGCFLARLEPGNGVTLIASTEPWSTSVAVDPEEAVGFYHQRRRRLVAAAYPAAREGVAAELVLAADKFIINPVGRVEDAARAHAAGDEVRTVLAGYHWFTDWGRDTMISLEGLTLITRRFTEAGWILRTFAHYVREGLIPNMFPEGKDQGLYHTADATLWLFHALDRYLVHTGDRATLKLILPKLVDIVDHHVRGTHFGIRVDPADGLLRQGEEGYQLTWMDAKVEDWVVTPRRGKAVEINALWYNALRLLAQWVTEEQGPASAEPLLEHASRAQESFNRRFWRPDASCLFDVVDGEKGDEPAFRPNQILAIALRHAVLREEYWQPVFDAVRERLFTPLGLRTLGREHPDYKPKYFGDLRARDAAYHQGTVWAWLLGPFVDAYLRIHPKDRSGARRFLEGIAPHLDEGCMGSISEIFDAEPPFTPRGCIAQAWSVAEVLRAYVNTAD